MHLCVRDLPEPKVLTVLTGRSIHFTRSTTGCLANSICCSSSHWKVFVTFVIVTILMALNKLIILLWPTLAVECNKLQELRKVGHAALTTSTSLAFSS